MELSIFLAKVIGLYFLIACLAVLINHKPFNQLVNEYVKDRPILLFHSLVALLIGLILVVSHNVWVYGWPVVITAIGWLTLLKGIAHLLAPQKTIEWGLSIYKSLEPVLFVIGLVIGIYLTYVGFTA